MRFELLLSQDAADFDHTAFKSACAAAIGAPYERITTTCTARGAGSCAVGVTVSCPFADSARVRSSCSGVCSGDPSKELGVTVAAVTSEPAVAMPPPVAPPPAPVAPPTWKECAQQGGTCDTSASGCGTNLGGNVAVRFGSPTLDKWNVVRVLAPGKYACDVDANNLDNLDGKIFKDPVDTAGVSKVCECEMFAGKHGAGERQGETSTASLAANVSSADSCASWCQQALVALPNAEPICAQSACAGCDACAAVLRLSTALEQAAALDLGSKPRRRLKLWPRAFTARARKTGPAIGNFPRVIHK